MTDQVYTTFARLYEDQGLLGFEYPDAAFEYIEAASQWIERKLGEFIPKTKTINLDGDGTVHLFVPPLLSVTSVTHDGDTLAATDYILYPRDRHWDDGPYTRLSIDPDASGLSVWKRERDVIAVVGSWGKYNVSRSTGAAVEDPSEQDASQTTLLVDDGGIVSPGDSLLIETEQELVTGYSGTGTDVGKNLSAAVAINDTVLTIETGHGINAGEIIRVDNEQMLALRGEGATTVLVQRAWNGTARAAHDSASDVYAYRTFTVRRAINGTTAATHANGTAISRYIPPAPVRYLATQIAYLMLKKAGTGYAGRTANLETGEIFYHKEFPKSVYDEIRTEFRC